MGRMALRTEFPVAVSADARYFVDSAGAPVFWLGTTQWELFRGYSLEDAATILERSAAHGFAFAQVMLAGVGDGTDPNVYGDSAWLDADPLKPNEDYFRHVDAVLRIAGERGIAILMLLYHQRYREHVTVENARRWAAWVAGRYRDVDNIVWLAAPAATEEYVPVLRELAAGLREGDGGRHLITLLPDPSPFSSSFVHDEPWLDFNSIQTWRDVHLIRPMVTHDYGLRPVKPVVMAEGAYEAGTEYGFDVTPLWVRRQAYYSFLSGAHHAYGHNDSWRVLPTWRQALDAPGAVQMGILKRTFTARREWWLLEPDQSVLASGGCTEGKLLRLAARHRDGLWAIVYLADAAEFSVDMGRLAGDEVRAQWVDPRTGDAVSAGSFPTKGQQSFSTREGWEDALLVLEAGASPSHPG